MPMDEQRVPLRLPGAASRGRHDLSGGREDAAAEERP
jgi:hypothetical protein